MSRDTPPGSIPADGGKGDRRAPTARYLEYGQEAVHEQFVSAASAAFWRLNAADDSQGTVQMEVGPPPQAPKRKLFGKQVPAPAPETVATTAALLLVARIASTTPAAVRAHPNSCPASIGVSEALATVIHELVNELIVLDPKQQRAHAAYRQTLHLGAELEAVEQIVDQVGCSDPRGCVGIRAPEHWGRREEDDEVAEVRGVLIKLATAGSRTSGRE